MSRSDASTWSTAAFAFALAIPSAPVLVKFGGIAAALAYPIALAAVLSRIRLASGWWLAVVFALVAIAFVVIYPLANSGAFGPGSDRDDALDQAARALFSGRNPYGAPTYLGKPLSPLPGAVILAAPFALLFGSSALQNLAWIGAALLLAHRELGPHGKLPAIAALLSPAVLLDVVTGGDLTANGIYVSFAVQLAMRRPSLVSGALVGVAAASRWPFLVLPIALAPRVPTRVTAAGAIVAAALAIPVALAHSPYGPFARAVPIGLFSLQYGVVLFAPLVVAYARRAGQRAGWALSS